MIRHVTLTLLLTVAGTVGPATAQPGTQVSVRVTDAGNGNPVAGATVAGATTDADGRAAVGPFGAGDQALQATPSEPRSAPVPAPRTASPDVKRPDGQR